MAASEGGAPHSRRQNAPSVNNHPAMPDLQQGENMGLETGAGSRNGATFQGVLLKSLAGHVIIDKVGFPSTILLAICPICFVFLLSSSSAFFGGSVEYFL